MKAQGWLWAQARPRGPSHSSAPFCHGPSKRLLPGSYASSLPLLPGVPRPAALVCGRLRSSTFRISSSEGFPGQEIFKTRFPLSNLFGKH